MDLVFVHGAADSAAVWDRQIEHFGGRHRVLAVDLPGHGERLAEKAFQHVHDSSDEVLRLADQEGLSDLVLVGHSLGGAIALTAAMRSPNAMRGLVLAGSGARLHMAAALMEVAQERASQAPGDQIVERLIPLSEVVHQASFEVSTWIAERFGRATARAVYADFLALDSFDLMGRIEEIGLPTLVIAGDHDRWTPPKFQHYLAEHLPRARLVLFENTGHYPFVEQAARFNAELEQFLTEI
ncbi:MAG: pip [Chloroflexi bacterium]|nr:pip [Chloroflexota bacterium]